MYDELFEDPAVIARYRAGPYAESREQFLRQARANGYSPKTLVRMAWALRIVAEAVQREGGRIAPKRLRSVLRRLRFKSAARPPSANTIKFLLQPGEAWLRGLGALIPEPERPLKFAAERRAFIEYMGAEQGLSPTTIGSRDEQLRWFCASLPSSVQSLRTVTIAHVDYSWRPMLAVDGAAAPCARSAVMCVAFCAMPHVKDGVDPISRRVLNCRVSMLSRTSLERQVWKRFAGSLQMRLRVLILSISVTTRSCHC
jgi:hypothetical protein